MVHMEDDVSVNSSIAACALVATERVYWTVA
jgi:hypothetical protein